MSQFEIDPNREYILLGDISGSMQEKDCPGGQSRYQYMLKRFNEFAQAAAENDESGISVYLFGEKVHSVIKDGIFNPDSIGNPKYEPATLTHLAIRAAFVEHEAKLSKSTVAMIFTDGQPSNKTALLDEIISITQKIARDEEFSIIFLTVGNIDDKLRNFLDGLDDQLKLRGAAFDIIDVKELMEIGGFYSAVDQAIND